MASIDEQYNVALLALKGEYSIALAKCNQILQKKEIFDVFVIKAVCLNNLGNFSEGVSISDDIILLDASRYEGYYHKGIGNFLRGEIKSALIAFNEAHSKTQNLITKNKISDWQRKCRAEIDKRYLQEFLLESVPTPNQAFTGSLTPSPVPVPQSYVVSSSGQLSYTWYQTNQRVGIEIIYTLSDQSQLRTVFDEKHVEISFPLGQGRTFDLSLELWGSISQDQSYAKVGLNKIEIYLEKLQPNQFWQTLEAEEESSQAQTEAPQNPEIKPAAPIIPQAAASYPTSSRKKKDWDKIDKEIEIDMHKNRDDYVQGDAAMDMFKWIYQGSDEDTRRAMMKSMQESGGKALSTNWKEVQDKDYKGKDRLSPPKGMVEQQYEY